MKSMQDFVDMKNQLLNDGFSDEEVLDILQKSLDSIEEMIYRNQFSPDVSGLKVEKIYLISVINAHKYKMEHPEQIKFKTDSNNQITAA